MNQSLIQRNVLTLFEPVEAERGEEAAEKNLSIDSGFLGGSVVKNLSANVGDTRRAGSTPGLGRSLE